MCCDAAGFVERVMLFVGGTFGKKLTTGERGPWISGIGIDFMVMYFVQPRWSVRILSLGQMNVRIVFKASKSRVMDMPRHCWRGRPTFG